MGSIYVLVDAVADVLEAPVPTSQGRRYAFPIECRFDGVHGLPLRTDLPEDTPDDLHLLFIHYVVVAAVVIPEAEVRPGSRQHFSLAGLLELTSPGPLGGLCPLELSELVENAVGKLAFWRIISPVIEGTDLGAVLLELPL